MGFYKRIRNVRPKWSGKTKRWVPRAVGAAAVIGGAYTAYRLASAFRAAPMIIARMRATGFGSAQIGHVETLYNEAKVAPVIRKARRIRGRSAIPRRIQTRSLAKITRTGRIY